MHRVKFLIIKPIRCTKISNLFLEWNSVFRTVPLSIVRSFHCTQQWYMSYRFGDSLWAGSRWNSVPSWSCSTVKNSWWRTEELSETCRVSCPKHVQFHSKNKFEKLVHLIGFIIRNRGNYSLCLPEHSAAKKKVFYLQCIFHFPSLCFTSYFIVCIECVWWKCVYIVIHHT